MSGDLNPEQSAAVEHRGGPLLVLAGAGSGKTRVITRRIVRLVREEASAAGIVAVTFTNKAAGEMRERVHSALDSEPSKLFLGTFHAWGLRLLRRYGTAIGLESGFSVYDRADQKELLRVCLERADDVAITPERALGQLSRLRNRMRELPPWGRSYVERLRARGAVDFDDLLLRPLELLRSDPGIADRIRPAHVLVDEFQDTSPAQSALLEAIWPDGDDVCVVGDEDQAIYGFRGATIENILAFEKAHPGTRVIRLVRNYRSTEPILQAASGLVRHNRDRLGKKLVAELGSGEPIVIARCASPESEAETIVVHARRMIERFGAGEVAVVYRTNAQSRLIEEAFVRHGVSYELVKGQRFYDRREIKDILAYVRLCSNPNDDAALERVINVPARGIGGVAKDELRRSQAASGGSLWQAACDLREEGGSVGRRLAGFVDLLARLRRRDDGPGGLVRAITSLSGYGRMLATEPDGGEQRVANVEELARKGDCFAASEDVLARFLDEVTLSSEPDREGGGAVALMTLHNAKGLEFYGVIIAGLEEGLLPHAGASSGWDDRIAIEEERRLLYVGITRARESLVMTLAPGRRLWVDGRASTPSRFLDELDDDLLRLEGEVAPSPAPGVVPTTVRTFRRRERGAPSGASASTAKPVPGMPAGPYPVGSWIRHGRYGEGMVMACEGAGDTLKVTVRFSAGMRKKLVAKYAKLETIRRR